MENYGGEFPTHYRDVRALKGVGDYTAGAICSIALGQPVPAVDGNVLRVVTRINGDTRDITTQRTKQEIARELTPLIPVQFPGMFTQAMMELGATVCLPNGAPLCDHCPAQKFCVAHLEGITHQIPVKAPKKARRIEERTVLLAFSENRVAICKRPDKGLLAGLWEYPNCLNGAEPDAWGRAEGRIFSAAARHIFTHVEWRMQAYTVEWTAETCPEEWVWATWEELTHRYAVPNAFSGLTYLVEERLR